MKVLRWSVVAVLIAAPLAVIGPAQAASLEVCQTGCTYSSIKTAVDAAGANDTISVAPGTYAEPQIVLDKPLSIEGAGEGQTIVNGGASNGIFQIKPVEATAGTGAISISDMTIESASSTAYAILVKLNRPTTGISQILLDGLDIQGKNGLYGVYAASGQTSGANRQAPHLTLSNSTISNTTSNNLGVDSYDGVVDIDHNVLHEAKNGNSAIFVGNEATPHRLTGELRVTDNTIEDGRLFFLQSNFGVVGEFAGYDKVTVTGNDISGLSSGDPGIFVGSYTASGGVDRSINDVTVTGNHIRSDGAAGSSGVTISGLVTSATVNENDIVGTDNAVNVTTDNGDSPSSVTAQRNRLIANTHGVSNTTTAKVNANENWWGCQNGPRSGSSFCSDVANTGTGTVDTSTWIRATAALSAGSVQTGTTATVGAALNQLNTGAAVAPLPAPLIGRPVAFSATRGTLSPGTAPLDGSLTATSTYTAPASSGADTVRVVVDSETVGATTYTGEPIDLPLTVTATPTPAGPEVTRFSGPDRYDTSAETSQGSFPDGAATVYVASGAAFPDGLSGGPAAAKADGPILLVRQGSVPDSVAAEIRRLDPDRIVLLGGTASVDDTVLNTLDGLAPTTRVEGPDRYGTAADVAEAWTSSDAVYLASGEAFPDALSGGATAAVKDAPLLLTRSSGLPEVTKTALQRLDPSSVVILGGSAAVDSAVQSQVEDALPEADVSRLAGADRYETSAKALTSSGLATSGSLMLASGESFADALGGGPAAAKLGAGFALTRRDCLPTSVADAVGDSVEHFYLLGGTAVVLESVVTDRCAS